MLEPNNSDTTTTAPDGAAPAKAAPAKAPRKRAVKKAAPSAPAATATADAAEAPATPAPRKRSPRKATAPAQAAPEQPPAEQSGPPAAELPSSPAPDAPRAAKRAARKPAGRARDAAAAPDAAAPDAAAPGAAFVSGAPAIDDAAPAKAPRKRAAKKTAPVKDGADAPAADDVSAAPPTLAAPSVLFVPPSEAKAPARARRSAKAPAGPPPTEIFEPAPADADITVAEAAEDQTAEPDDVREAAVEEATGARRRRRRGRRGRGGGTARGEDVPEDDDVSAPAEATAQGDTADTIGTEPAAEGEDTDDSEDAAKSTRRRRRRRSGAGTAGTEATDDDPPNTVVHVRPPREKAERSERSERSDRGGDGDDGVRGVKGSTRLEAKRQRRRDGRDTGRRRPAILTESEFLARRESVDRVMAVRQHGDRTQIAVLEDDILVEHYVTRASATSYVGNVYLGRVQNVLPSMEAAFVDIGKGRNGVLYAGEVNWDAAGLEGKSRAIEHALKSGDVVLVQVTKDPIGHKGARLTSQVSLPGRFLVYVPGGGMTGISRKLPDTERHRLKSIMKKIVPEDAGVIIRTAAEGASEEDLTHDVERLKAQWEKMSKKAQKTSAAPTLVHGEPDLAIRVVRDVFNEDFKRLVVQGDGAWQTVSDYIKDVAPDLAERSSRHTADTDLFHDLRVDEQLMKALARKVYLPSGGSLVIDRTEAMTVIDVNTGKFIGSGGNLEQTVTRNNLEAAEEIVRQLRLRDVGGIVVIDFIDMVLESNRDLVLRRLTECLGRDRTKHQVAEVTSLGLVQMTRKRVGEGLLEAFSEPCSVCNGRGVILHAEPVERALSSSEDGADQDEHPKAKRKRGGAKKPAEPVELEPEEHKEQRLAAIAAIHRAAHPDAEPADGDGAAEAQPDGGEGDGQEQLWAGSAETDDGAADAEPAPTEPIDAADAEAVQGEPTDAEPADTAPADAEPAEANHAEPIEAADAEAVQSRPAPRRRRAASRPAGPPVAVG